MVRFYQMDYRAVLALPLRVFWMLNTQVNRIRAEETINAIDLHLVTHQGMTQEGVDEFRSLMRQRLGNPMNVRETLASDTHEKGLAALRQALS